MSAAEPLIVSLDEFAELAQVTSETMRGYLKEVGKDGRVPAWLVERGGRGQAYKIEAEGALAWWRDMRDSEVAGEEERKGRLQQLRLEMVGDAGAEAAEQLSMSGRQRKEEYEAAFAALKYRRQLGQLLDRVAVEQVLSAAAVDLRRRLQRLPAEFGIAAGLTADQVRELEALLERNVGAFVDEITKPDAFQE